MKSKKEVKPKVADENGIKVYAKDQKCCKCGEQAVAFFPVCDPDIQSYPYCQKHLDEARTGIFNEIEKLNKPKRKQDTLPKVDAGNRAQASPYPASGADLEGTEAKGTRGGIIQPDAPERKQDKSSGSGSRDLRETPLPANSVPSSVLTPEEREGIIKEIYHFHNQIPFPSELCHTCVNLAVHHTEQKVLEKVENEWGKHYKDLLNMAKENSAKHRAEMDTLRTEKEDTRDSILSAFECLGLCHSCWRNFLECENKPELADKIYKWFRGQYADNRSAEERLKKKLTGDEKDTRIKELEQERERMLSDERIWEVISIFAYEPKSGRIHPHGVHYIDLFDNKKEAIQAVRKILKGE